MPAISRKHLHGWRLHDAGAGAGAILDLTVHDADLLRFILGYEPEAVTAFAQNSGLAAAGIEDAALSLIRFRSGLLAQLFDGFTTRYAETGVEVHGSERIVDRARLPVADAGRQARFAEFGGRGNDSAQPSQLLRAGRPRFP